MLRVEKFVDILNKSEYHYPFRDICELPIPMFKSSAVV